jgi:hypothetical protein
MRIKTVTNAWLVSLLVWSCQHEQPEPLVPAAGTIQAIDEAVDRIAMAQCDYEQRCQHIGPEMRYSNRDHCMNVMHSEARKDLNQCRAGVDQADLRECLTQIANQDCGGAFRNLEEYKECHMDDLCD